MMDAPGRGSESAPLAEPTDTYGDQMVFVFNGILVALAVLLVLVVAYRALAALRRRRLRSARRS